MCPSRPRHHEPSKCFGTTFFSLDVEGSERLVLQTLGHCLRHLPFDVLLVEAMMISAMIMAAGMLLQRLLCSPRKGAASIVLPVTAAGKEN